MVILLVYFVGLELTKNRTLFLFSEDNLLRKYAKMIIEWGYPSIRIRKNIGLYNEFGPSRELSLVQVTRCKI